MKYRIPRPIKYLFFPKSRIWSVPSHLSSRYNLEKATEEEIMLMKSGHARCPQEAQKLMTKHRLRAWEIIQQYPRQRDTMWTRFKRRTNAVLMRIEGASNYKRPHQRPKNRLPVYMTRRTNDEI